MPDNITYLYLGLLVVLGLPGLYVLVLFLRFRSAYRERRLIRDIQDR